MLLITSMMLLILLFCRSAQDGGTCHARGSPQAVTAAVVQREFVRHMQQCHLLRGKLHDGGALCQVPLLHSVSRSLAVVNCTLESQACLGRVPDLI